MSQKIIFGAERENHPKCSKQTLKQLLKAINRTARRGAGGGGGE